jgi:hypothetical protein
MSALIDQNFPSSLITNVLYMNRMIRSYVSLRLVRRQRRFRELDTSRDPFTNLRHLLCLMSALERIVRSLASTTILPE